MKNYQIRVIEEKQELDEKLDKLGAFINTNKFKSLVGDERDRLFDQQTYMEDYRNVLAERIEAFTP